MKRARRSSSELVKAVSVAAGVSRRAHFRIFLIHEMLQRGGHPNCQTMAGEIEVDRKTIQRDISYMRDEMAMPIAYDEARHGYYYTSAVEEFPLLQLSKQDLMALFLARKAMEPLKGTRMERVLSESFAKIARGCPGDVTFQWGELDEAFSMRVVGVAEADVTLFGDVLDAVRGRKEVTFDYHKLESDRPEPRLVRPYHVRQIENGWYLLGYDVDREAMRTFALQRMSLLCVLKRSFKRDGSFDVEEYFGGSFGVWSYEDAEGRAKRYEVCIRLDGYAARVVQERRWHVSQEIVPVGRKGEIELRMRLAGLEEIARWVLSWGRHARVVGPEVLRAKVAREIEAMASISRE